MGKHGKCVKVDNCRHDIEACYPPGAGGGGEMYPNMMESPQLRWGFIRKVYSIVCLQLLLTVAVAATVNLVGPIADFFRSRTPPAIAAIIAVILFPIIVMIPMIIFRKRHPWNLVLLAVFTIAFSLTVGLSCLTAKGPIILEAVVITMVVVLGLTVYTFWAAKQGYDFEFIWPFLFAAILVLMFFTFLRFLFPMGKMTTMVYGCIAALLFSGFIIYDTDNLIKRYPYDEYVAAAIELYLDIINLFEAILTILEGVD